MENNQRPDKSTGPGLRNRRPTIGCLTPIISDDNGQALWSGLTDIARKRDVNLICFPGGWLSDPRGFQAQANVLYELANAENVEGVVSWGTSIGSYIDADELGAFHERYRPLPVVIAGGALEGFPSLPLDSYTSMRAAIVHLIEAHGYRRLAFIRGPEDSFHAQERYRAYVETLKAHGLPVDPDLITWPLPWDPSTGKEAMHLLLDKRGLRPHTDFDAVVGASDELLLGALEVLQTRGVKVPGDVAAVGFDDSAEGKAHTPPFTSVASPHYEMGYRGVEMLLSLMEGGQVAGETLVPELVIRQSCGCLDPAIVQAAVDPGEVRGETLESFPASRREQAFSEMAQAVGESSKNVASGWEERLLEGFSGELKGGAPGLFLQELGEVLRQAMAAGGDVSAWQGAVSALRRQIVPYLDGERLRRAENLWQQARVMTGETAQRAQAYQALQAAQQARTLREIETALLTTFDVADLMDTLAQNLPRLGIPSCYLALYEDPQPYRYPQPAPEWSRLVLAYTEQGRVELEPGGRRFRSCELVPEGVLLQERRYNLVVEPLYFQENQLGFVLLEVGPREGAVYETLRTQISSALQGTLLTEQVAHRALQLQTAAEVSRAATDVLDLSTLLQQVVELVQKRFDLYYVGLFLIEGAEAPDGTSATDRSTGPLAWAVLQAASGEAGRQMLEQGHRLAVGGASMIGQCITDHQPRIALDVGREAVRFNNPLLPDTHSEMALPLITREGAIGALSVQSTERAAFGEAEIAVFETLAGQLANAIANARAYARVAHAYEEIQALNERLKDENLRMAAELEVTRRLQQMLLPTDEELAQIEGLDIAGWMEPAEEVGGDYYDVLQHNGSVRIGIGDVTGHGLESGVVMLMIQTAVRTLLTEGEEDPARLLEVLNQLLRDNTRRMQVRKSMTLSLLNYELGRMRVSGQHEYVIVVQAGGKIRLVDTMDLGFPLGIKHGIAQWVDEMDVALASGDGVVLYSDGITEAENEAGAFYGLERLCEVVSANWEGSAEEIKDAVMVDVKAFIGSQRVYDDLTLLIVKQR